MDKKTWPIYMLSTRDHLRTKKQTERMEKNIPFNWKQKKAGVPILISDKIDFKQRPSQETKEVTT